MNVKATRQYEMLVRVQRFGVEHAAVFRSDRIAGQAFAAVRNAVRDVESAAASHSDGRGRVRERAASKGAAAKALKARLARVRLTARAIAIDTPGFDTQFRLPRPMSYAALLMLAQHAVQAAREHASLFTAHGLPRTFVADLQACIAAFEDADGGQASGRQMRVTARHTIQASLRAGGLACRRLDAVVANAMDEDPMAMAGWETARRVSRPRAIANAAPRPQPPAPPDGPPSR